MNAKEIMANKPSWANEVYVFEDGAVMYVATDKAKDLDDGAYDRNVEYDRGLDDVRDVADDDMDDGEDVGSVDVGIKPLCTCDECLIRDLERELNRANAKIALSNLQKADMRSIIDIKESRHIEFMQKVAMLIPDSNLDDTLPVEDDLLADLKASFNAARETIDEGRKWYRENAYLKRLLNEIEARARLASKEANK